MRCWLRATSSASPTTQRTLPKMSSSGCVALTSATMRRRSHLSTPMDRSSRLFLEPSAKFVDNTLWVYRPVISGLAFSFCQTRPPGLLYTYWHQGETSASLADRGFCLLERPPTARTNFLDQ